MKQISSIMVRSVKRILFIGSILTCFSVGGGWANKIGFLNDSSKKEVQGLLWRITGNGLDHPSYLYGTMHTTDERAFQFQDETMEVFKDCDVFAMELNVDSAKGCDLMNKLVMDSSYTLKGLLGEDYDMVNRVFRDSMGRSLAMFNKVQPMYVATMLQQASLGKDSSVAVDLYFHRKAKASGKRVIGLETLEEQVGTFGSIPYKKQANYLVEAVNKYKKAGGSTTSSLVRHYVNGNLKKMLEMTREDQPTENFTAVFLDERNHRMADRAERYIQEESVFIAIGAAHLPGKAGVIELFREKGYTVQKVK